MVRIASTALPPACCIMAPATSSWGRAPEPQSPTTRRSPPSLRAVGVVVVVVFEEAIVVTASPSVAQPATTIAVVITHVVMCRPIDPRVWARLGLPGLRSAGWRRWAERAHAIISVVQIHDISAPLRDDLPTWPGEEGLKRTLVATQPDDDATVSHLAFGAHTGTHIDAPVHFLVEGSGIDAFPSEVFVGPCFVADLRHVPELITGDDLNEAGIPEECIRVLALTRNSGWSHGDTEFRSDYVAFSASAAAWCLDRGVRLLGNDYLSVEAFESDGFPVHVALLGAGVALLEGIDLEGVSPGSYELVALPILVPGSDGAPARAVLVER